MLTKQIEELKAEVEIGKDKVADKVRSGMQASAELKVLVQEYNSRCAEVQYESLMWNEPNDHPFVTL